MRPNDVRHLPVLLVAVLVGALTGCGPSRSTTGESASSAYPGPLVVARDQATHPRAGAAGDVVECDTWGRGGLEDGEVYAEGETADSPEGALDVARSEWHVDGPLQGLLLAAEEPDRVLWVLEVDEVVKLAVVVRDGPATEGAGGDGWYVESWARCDNAELPRWWTEEIGLLVWHDAATGEPVPTTELEAWQGPEHCDWESMVFLHLDGEMYVRDPVPDLAGYVVEEWQDSTELPDDAVDTGFEREGERLWVAADRRSVYVGTPDDVERWPRAREPFACA